MVRTVEPRDPNAAEDHALGLELQLIELVERQERARVQHRGDEVTTIQREIDVLQIELAELADATARLAEAAPPPVEFRGAEPA